MTICSTGDIVRVPFPHVEQGAIVSRPAYVLAAIAATPDIALIWTLMITNAARPGWADDIFIEDWRTLGLIIPSKIRTSKITTNESREAVVLGRASASLIAAVAIAAMRHLGRQAI